MDKSNFAYDGIHARALRENMSDGARKIRDYYERTPGAPFYKKEFGFYCLERWKEQGMPDGTPLEVLFDYDEPGEHHLGQLGWCEAGLTHSLM